MEVKIRSEISE